MKLEDLKRLEIGGAYRTYMSFPENSNVAVAIFHNISSAFDDQQTALLAAAHFRASHEVVESCKNLLAALEDFHISVEDYPWISEAFERFRAALALADNTSETINTNEK